MTEGGGDISDSTFFEATALSPQGSIESGVESLSGTLTQHWQTNVFQIDGLDIQDWLETLDLGSQITSQDLATLADSLEPGLEQTSEELSENSMRARVHDLMRMMVGDTYYMRLSVVQRLRLTVLSGLLAALITSSPPVAIGTTLGLTLWDSVRRLSDEELDVIHAMQRLTDHKIYTKWLELDAILDALPGDHTRNQYRETIATLKKLEILEEAAGLWRAIR